MSVFQTKMKTVLFTKFVLIFILVNGGKMTSIWSPNLIYRLFYFSLQPKVPGTTVFCKNFFKYVKVNKSSHKTSKGKNFVLITVKNCIGYQQSCHIVQLQSSASEIYIKINCCSHWLYFDSNLAVSEYSQWQCTVNGCN